MLGHVAQSVGGALPGVGGSNPFVGQFFSEGRPGNLPTFQISVPPLALFAFIELQAQGGGTSASNSVASAGGAASDGIFAVAEGQVLNINLASSRTTAPTASVELGGSTLLSANSPPVSSAATQGGPTGKYPGFPAVNQNSPGKGGGRLSTYVNGSDNFTNNPIGSGRRGSTAGAFQGGLPAVCATFFTTYDAAVAFANSLYGGNWQP